MISSGFALSDEQPQPTRLKRHWLL